MSLTKLYLDDVRTPTNYTWGVVRSYKEFVDWIETNSLPDIISLDHDLCLEHSKYYFANIKGKEDAVIDYDSFKVKTGYDCAIYLIEYCVDNKLKLTPTIYTHSHNEVGRMNIINALNSFWKFQKLDKYCYFKEFEYTTGVKS